MVKILPLFVKAITINRPLKPSLPLVIDDYILLDMIKIIENLEYPIVYLALIFIVCFPFFAIM